MTQFADKQKSVSEQAGNNSVKESTSWAAKISTGLAALTGLMPSQAEAADAKAAVPPPAPAHHLKVDQNPLTTSNFVKTDAQLAAWKNEIESQSAKPDSQTYKIQANDTLYGIAKKHNLPLSALTEANPELDARRLKPGTEIKIPTQRTIIHVVADGEIAGGIAHHYGLRLDALKQANPDIPDISKLSIGQELTIPVPNVPKPALAPTVYEVKGGDTLWGIAKTHNVKPDELKAINPDINPDRLKVGQKIKIPGDDPVRYTVKQGDTFDDIAKSQGLRTGSLLKANPELNPKNLQIGQDVVIPRPTAQELHDREVLRSYIGRPYGPVYPRRTDNGGMTEEAMKKKYNDCLSLVTEFARQTRGLKLTGSKGDQIYARHTEPVATLDRRNTDLSQCKTGDIVIIGHPFEAGEGGVSAYHLGVLCEPKYGPTGEVCDFSFVHASGSYNKDRTQYWGKVKEVSLLDYHKNNRSDPNRNHMFIGRLPALQMATLLPGLKK